MAKSNLIGLKFGKLTVCSLYGKNKRREFLWQCKCECGNDTIVPTNKLKNGHTKSCGCLTREYEDLTGLKFGRLTVLKRVESPLYKCGKHPVSWLCECDCGNTKIAQSRNLKAGITKSCGCYYTEVSSHHPKHGLSGTRLESIWRTMKQRCNNPNSKSYKYYGGRGIKICEEWNKPSGVECFAEWALANGYKDNLTLDRINTNGNYEPSNCRWVTMREQNRNSNKNVFVTYRGETKILSDWARELNIPYSTIRYKVKNGKTIDEIVDSYSSKRLLNHEYADNKVREMA